MIQSLADALNIHTEQESATCIIDIINLFVNNPIPVNENNISAVEDMVRGVYEQRRDCT